MTKHLLFFFLLVFYFNVQAQWVLGPIHPKITEFHLYQNIPNPFYFAGTTITYDIPSSTLVNIWITDNHLNTLSTIVNEVKDAGRYSVVWNIPMASPSLPSSDYVVHMRTGQFSDSMTISYSNGVNRVPGEFYLYRNVPNPFDSSGTTIEFGVYSISYVDIWITDSLQNDIGAHLSSQMAIGVYTAKWNVGSLNPNLSPGTYQCHMTANDLQSSSVPIFSDSIWMQFLPSLTSTDKISQSNNYIYTLNQNYPNPFNPTTTIKYSILKTSFVTLKVYDVLGKEITTLVNKEKQAGNYNIEFNGSDLSSGVYFYKLQAGDFVKSQKMILLK